MEQNNKICIKARLVGQKTDNAYTIYVFQDTEKLDFIMCSKMPNWQTDEVEIAEEGFLEYRHVIGGQDRYYDNESGKYRLYQTDATYFLNFVPITKVLKDGYVIDKSALIVS